MGNMHKVVFVAAIAAGLAAPPVLAGGANAPSTQSSGPGVQDAEGGKNGPAAEQPGDSNKMRPSTGSTGASSGTNGEGIIDPTTVPAQDSTGTKGAPGNKSGPASKPSGED
jgi:hypothetical protein